MAEPRSLPKSPRLITLRDTIDGIIELFKSLGQLIEAVKDLDGGTP